jgi:rare lipoprotein A
MAYASSTASAPAFGAFLALSAVLAAGCASSQVRPSKSPVGETERGVASWYGPGFHGRDTASGEPYDMHAQTAAHRTLPFGAIVEVRNLDNGLVTQVRINDRGPFRKSRVIDLSNAAARAIEMIGPGTARVELRVIGFADTPGRFVVQVGAFQERELADSLQAAICREFPAAAVRSDAVWHRVQVGDFADREEAEAVRRKLERSGYPALVVAVAGVAAVAN